MMKLLKTIVIGKGVAAALTGLMGMAFFYPPVQSLFSRLVAERDVEITRDVRYGAHERHALDIYRPAGDTGSSPIVFFIYGGSWRYGHRSAYGFVGAALAARGITAVIPDYRLYPEVKFPSFVEDAALAYRWANRNLLSEGGRRRPVILAGHSAGAHMAALLAYDARYLGPGTPRPEAFVGLAGPYAFDPTTWPSTADIFSTAKSADEARPVSFVDASAPRSLLFHGKADDLVKLWNTRTLAERLTMHGVPVRTFELEGVGHLGIVLALARPFRWRASVLAEIVRYIHDIEPAGVRPSLAKGAP